MKPTRPSSILTPRSLAVLAGLSLVATASPAFATLAVTNGDFETGVGNNLENVTSWFDFNTGNFWEGAWQTNNGGVTPNATGVIVFSSFEADNFGSPTSDVNDGSYLYQAIGTADGLTSVNISFDWGAPNDDPGGRALGITVGIYAYDGVGAFTAADNTDVRGAAGVTLLDSQSFTLTSTGVDGQVVTEMATLSIAAAASQQLFLRFDGYTAGATQSWPILDNVVLTTVPEPSTYAVLAGVAGLLGTVAIRRRRR